MATVANRVGRLEAAKGGVGGGSGCSECGWPHDGNLNPGDTYEIVWLDDDEDPDEPMLCETCGRETPEITWDDAIETARKRSEG